MKMKSRVLPMLVTLAFAAVLVISGSSSFIDGDASENSGKTIDFAQFLQELDDSKIDVGDGKYDYVYDGKGITVQWSPTSACTDDRASHTCLITDDPGKEADGNNPQRIENKVNAQYQILKDGDDVHISNVNFIFIPADFTICMNSGWRGSTTAEQTLNAELQFLNSGDVRITGCNFDQVNICSFNSTTETEIVECSFVDVYNSYCLYGLYSPSVTVSKCIFGNSSGAIYLEGHVKAVERKTVTITDNTFMNIGYYGAEGKENSRGLIQISAKDDYSSAAIVITGNVSNNDASVIRQLNPTITDSNLDMDMIVNDNDFRGMLFIEERTIYVDTSDGDDANAGSKAAPVKTISKASSLSYMGGTIIVSGDIADLEAVDRSVILKGTGKITGDIYLPEKVGYLMLSGFTIPSLSIKMGSNCSSLNLVFDDCVFETDSSIALSGINSLVTKDCTFAEAPEESVIFDGDSGSVASDDSKVDIVLSGSNSSLRIESDDGTPLSVSVSITNESATVVTGASSVFDIRITASTGYTAEITLPVIVPTGFTVTVVSYDDNGNKIEEHSVISVDASSITFRTTHNTTFAVFVSESPSDNTSGEEEEEYPFFPWGGNNQGSVVTPVEEDSSDDNTKVIAAAAAIVVIMLAAVAMMVNRNN